MELEGSTGATGVACKVQNEAWRGKRRLAYLSGGPRVITALVHPCPRSALPMLLTSEEIVIIDDEGPATASGLSCPGSGRQIAAGITTSNQVRSASFRHPRIMPGDIDGQRQHLGPLMPVFPPPARPFLPTALGSRQPVVRKGHVEAFADSANRNAGPRGWMSVACRSEMCMGRVDRYTVVSVVRQ